MMAAMPASSPWNTRAVPVKRSPSWPVIFATAPSGARSPRRITKWPSGLMGLSNGRMMRCPAGYGCTSAKSSRSVLPVTVRQFPCNKPASNSVFINGRMPPMAMSSDIA